MPLGGKVRFDGGHKKDAYLTDVLGEYFAWYPVCPELEVGMGVPREPVHLIGSAQSPRLVGAKSGADWTSRMKEFSTARLRELERLNLSGFIFKSNSPTCGVERVRVHSEKGIPAKSGRGLFAAQFMNTMPLIPVEEEGRLNDARLRENFIVRVFSYHRLLNLRAAFSARALVQFHTVHKYLLLVHSPKQYAALGRLVAAVNRRSQPAVLEEYSRLFMEALSVRSTPSKNTNVLHHILGHLRNYTSSREKASLLSVITDYHRELVPLIVPITLLNHYVEKYDVPYLNEQIYLHPHPKELMLRNRV